ncbi:MAG: L,D-transpeptidase [Verrucomicrobiota bacterium]|nr:L,D-transpeptidase [Verrucomicrobiota bacterium]
MPLSIHVSVPKQRLTLKRGRKTERTYPVSTSAYGLGSEPDSMKTPLGRFQIAQKIGDAMPIETAFKSREPVPLTPEMLREEDLIMSRILWLHGIEPHNSNTRDRYVYIHGTNHEETIGTPASHGCIRMRNADVAELFDLVEVGTSVLIVANESSGRPRKSARKALRTKGVLPK